MSWARFDDTFWTNPKLERLTDRAHRLWVRGVGYACQYLTDGVLDPTALRTLGAHPKAAAELVAGGLWHPVPDGGYTIHDYLEFNPTRADVENRRAATKARVAKHRSVANQHPDTGRYT